MTVLIMASPETPKKKESMDSERGRRRDTNRRTASKLCLNPVYQQTVRDFTEEQLKEYREIFRLFDKDNSGCISYKELTTVLKSLGKDPEDEAICDMMSALDFDDNGVIEFCEFLNLMARMSLNNDTESDLIDVFRVLDQDGDGYITKADLREVCVRLESDLSHNDMEEMLAEADHDGDGMIGYEEFLKIVLSRM